MQPFNNIFLLACQRKPTPYIPVWFMRQAGRYQPEYREIRKKYDLITICKTPDVCAQVTLLPVQQLGVDAAILFSDIMLPLEPMGIRFGIKENVGPVIENPVKSLQQVQEIRDLRPEDQLPFVGQTIKQLRASLQVPLIGFSGAPFTLASYLIEGGPSKNFTTTKVLMYSQPDLWHTLLEKLTSAMAGYLSYQVRCGAQALQVFDSWVGNLSKDDYRAYVRPHMRRLFDQLKLCQVPVIHFGVSTGHLLELMQEAGGDVIGVDWRASIDEAWKRMDYKVAIQGNLDPSVLLGPWEIVERKTLDILRHVKRWGFIFNLGHGVLPKTEMTHLQRLVELVHHYKPEHIA